MSVPTCSRMTRTWLALLLVALLAPAPVSAQDATRIGYVDMKRLLDNAPQVVAGRAQLQREFAPRDRELKGAETRLAELQVRASRDAAILPREQADALQREIGALQRSVERTRTRLREDLKARSETELAARWEEINDAVLEFAREENYDLIVPSPVIFASPRVDVTEAVLERLKRDYSAQAQQ